MVTSTALFTNAATVNQANAPKAALPGGIKRYEEEAAKPVVPGGALKKTPGHLSNQLSNQLSNRPIAPAYVGGKKELLSAKAPEFEGAKAIREKKGLKGMNGLTSLKGLKGGLKGRLKGA